MPKRLARGNRLVWGASLLCLASGGYLAWQVWRPDEALPVPPDAVAEAVPASSAQINHEEGFALGDASTYEDIVERPLFDRTRRPPAADADGSGAAGGAGGQDEVAAANLSLAGVLLTRSRRVALLRIDNDPKVMHVAEGQQAGGWLIEEIQPDRVLLRRGESSGVVMLDYRRHPEGDLQRPDSPRVRPTRHSEDSAEPPPESLPEQLTEPPPGQDDEELPE